MAKIIGVRFRNAGKIYYFDPGRYIIKENSAVIVETVQGIEYADVVIGTREVADSEIVAPLKGIVRVATQADIRQAKQQREKEALAFAAAESKIAAHKLEMKLVRVEYAFDGSKIVFFFTSEGRVDFRELVKDLAQAFKTRIELRQIGARDETKLLGGLGMCGQHCCCNRFLNDFTPVSIKMAKEQGLSLNPTKISGLCGRLMCCLQYEQSTYESIRRLLPKVGANVRTPDGLGKVCEQCVLKESVKVRMLNTEEENDIRTYSYQDVQTVKDGENAPREEARPKAKAESATPQSGSEKNGEKNNKQRENSSKARPASPKPDKAAQETAKKKEGEPKAASGGSDAKQEGRSKPRPRRKRKKNSSAGSEKPAAQGSKPQSGENS